MFLAWSAFSFVSLLLSLACAPGSPVGQLAFIRPTNESTGMPVTVDGGVLWWVEANPNGFTDVFRADVSDPRRPLTERVRSSPVELSFYSWRPFIVQKGRVYLLNEEALDLDGTVLATPGRTLGMAAVSDHALALISIDIDDLNDRDLIIVDPLESMATDSLVVVAQVPLDYWDQLGLFTIEADRERVFITNSLELAVYDLTDPSQPSLIGRASVEVPDGSLPRLYAVDDTELFFWSLEEDDGDYRQVSWFKTDETFSPVSTFSTVNGFKHIGGVKKAGDHLLVSTPQLRGHEGPCTAAFRLDAQEGLVERRVTGAPASFRPFSWLDVDESRGLMFVGGDGIQVVDLGMATTGTPAWP